MKRTLFTTKEERIIKEDIKISPVAVATAFVSRIYLYTRNGFAGNLASVLTYVPDVNGDATPALSMAAW